MRPGPRRAPAFRLRGSRTTRARARTVPAQQPVAVRTPSSAVAACFAGRSIGAADGSARDADALRRIGQLRCASAISALRSGDEALEVGADAEAFDGAEHFRDREDRRCRAARRSRRERATGGRWRRRCAGRGRTPGCARSADSRGRARAPWRATARRRTISALERLAGEQRRDRVAAIGLAAVRRARGPRSAGDRRQQRSRIFRERDAFELQFLGAAVAEFGDVALDLARERGMAGERGAVAARPRPRSAPGLRPRARPCGRCAAPARPRRCRPGRS